MLTMRNGTKYYRENELEKLGYVKIEKLNKELKDKINNILNGRYKPWFEKVNGLKEEILELLK